MRMLYGVSLVDSSRTSIAEPCSGLLEVQKAGCMHSRLLPLIADICSRVHPLQALEFLSHDCRCVPAESRACHMHLRLPAFTSSAAGGVPRGPTGGCCAPVGYAGSLEACEALGSATQCRLPHLPRAGWQLLPGWD